MYIVKLDPLQPLPIFNRILDVSTGILLFSSNCFLIIQSRRISLIILTYFLWKKYYYYRLRKSFKKYYQEFNIIHTFALYHLLFDSAVNLFFFLLLYITKKFFPFYILYWSDLEIRLFFTWKKKIQINLVTLLKSFILWLLN